MHLIRWKLPMVDGNELKVNTIMAFDEMLWQTKSICGNNLLMSEESVIFLTKFFYDLVIKFL